MADQRKLPPRGGPLPGTPNPFAALQIRGLRSRLFVLVGLFLLLVVIMAGLWQYRSTDEAQTISSDVPTQEVERFMFSGVPVLDMELAKQLSDGGPDARRRWPTEAVQYLLLEAQNTPAVHAYQRNLLPVTGGSAAEIEKNSRPWRFKFVRFRGELEYTQEQDYEADYGSSGSAIGRVHRGRVRIAGSDPPVRVLYLTPTMPMWSDPNESTPRPEVKLIEDGWVRGRGILVQNYVDGTGGQEVPVLLVVATRIERDYETVPVESLESIPFGIIDDDPSIGASEEGRLTLAKEYPRPLFRLVKYASERAGAAGAAKRAEEGLKPAFVKDAQEWEEILGQPARFRARYFGGLGAVAESPLHYVPENAPANDAGIDEFLNGWIVTDEQKLIQFLAPIELQGEWKTRTRVRWEGFFYKTKLYAARNGTDRLAPVFVLTVLEEVHPPRPHLTFHFILAGSFIVGMAVLIFIIVREDRTKESYRRLRHRRAAKE